MKIIRILLLTIIASMLFYVPAYAVENDGFADRNERELMDKYDLQIQNTCSNHNSFIHYLVREDGGFAVYYRTAEHNDKAESVFSRAYIDVFSVNGEFQVEISLNTRDDITLRFSEDKLEIYLSTSMLSVDLSTFEVTETITERYYGKESGLHERFIQKNQEANGMRYSCRGFSMNYTMLIREQGDAEEVLLSLSGNIPGTQISKTYFGIKALLSGIILLFVGMVCKYLFGKTRR